VDVRRYEERPGKALPILSLKICVISAGKSDLMCIHACQNQSYASSPLRNARASSIPC
jgi:hypothetical protein